MWIFLFTIVFDCHRASIFFPIWIKQFAILAEEPALVNWKTVSPLSGDAKTADEYGLEYETVTFIFPQPLHFPLFKQFFIPRTVFFFFFFFYVLIEERFLATEQFPFFFLFSGEEVSSIIIFSIANTWFRDTIGSNSNCIEYAINEI